MSMTGTKNKRSRRTASEIDRQITQAKTVLSELRGTLEDLDDRRELAKARNRNANKPGTGWNTVKKELGLEF